jgi:hypothetical protein
MRLSRLRVCQFGLVVKPWRQGSKFEGDPNGEDVVDVRVVLDVLKFTRPLPLALFPGV